MKIKFTKQFRPAASLEDKQAIGEELSEYIKQEYGLNDMRIVKVGHTTNPAGPEFTIESSCPSSRLYQILFRLSEGELDAYSLESVLDKYESSESDAYELAKELNHKLHLSEYDIELLG